jgi:hypothetical protein
VAHLDHHPEPVEGCFGCKVLGIGWQGKQSAAGGRRADPVERQPVVADDGPSRGRVVGAHRVHWDGRQDARVQAPTVRLKAKTTEAR